MSSEKSQILQILIKASNAEEHIFAIADVIDKQSGSKFVASHQAQSIKHSVDESIQSLKSIDNMKKRMLLSITTASTRPAQGKFLKKFLRRGLERYHNSNSFVFRIIK